MASSLRNKRIILRPNEEASFPLHGDSIKVTAANVPIYFKTRDGNLDFYLQVGEKASFEGNDFIDLVVYHLDASDQAVIVSVGKDADIGSATIGGNVTITGGVIDLSASSLAALENTTIQDLGVPYGASYASSALLAANVAVPVFSAAANVNGAIIHVASFLSENLTPNLSLIAKATAPANVLDGDVLLSPQNGGLGGSSRLLGATLQNPLKIAAGKGLYFISTILENYGNRSVLYTLL